MLGSFLRLCGPRPKPARPGLVAIGICVGLVNAGLIRKVGLPSIIATLATLSVMQGLSLKLRPYPGGEISFDVSKNGADVLHLKVPNPPLFCSGGGPPPPQKAANT